MPIVRMQHGIPISQVLWCSCWHDTHIWLYYINYIILYHQLYHDDDVMMAWLNFITFIASYGGCFLCWGASRGRCHLARAFLWDCPLPNEPKNAQWNPKECLDIWPNRRRLKCWSLLIFAAKSDGFALSCFILAYPHAGPCSHWGPSCFGGLAKIPAQASNWSNSPTIHFQYRLQP